MTTLQINKGHLPSEVRVPASKSYANRALILGAIKSSMKLKSVPLATDVVLLIQALKKSGLEIAQKGNDVTISNSFPECEKEGATIDIGEGGTTARFLAALLLLGKKPYTLILGRRLKDRPWDELINVSRELGASVRLNGERLELQGPVKHPTKLSVDCSRTTQFATAFDLILPETEIEPKNVKSSQSYLMMNETLKDYFKDNSEYSIPLDWSSAAYPMVFAALNQRIQFPDLTYDPFQADSKLLAVLNELGAVETSDNGLIVSKMLRPSPVKLPMNDCLDLFPAMVFLLSHIEGEHELSGLENLVYKESDRLSEMTKLVNAFGRECSYARGVFKLKGSSEISGPLDLSLPDDHRIVMTAALFLRHHSGGTLTPAEAVTKSYPEFFQLMESKC